MATLGVEPKTSAFQVQKDCWNVSLLFTRSSERNKARFRDQGNSELKPRKSETRRIQGKVHYYYNFVFAVLAPLLSLWRKQ